jgi:hypothetical protein
MKPFKGKRGERRVKSAWKDCISPLESSCLDHVFFKSYFKKVNIWLLFFCYGLWFSHMLSIFWPTGTETMLTLTDRNRVDPYGIMLGLQCQWYCMESSCTTKSRCPFGSLYSIRILIGLLQFLLLCTSLSSSPLLH